MNISNLTIRHGIIRIDTRSNKWWIRLWQVWLSEQLIELVTQDSPKTSQPLQWPTIVNWDIAWFCCLLLTSVLQARARVYMSQARRCLRHLGANTKPIQGPRSMKTNVLQDANNITTIRLILGILCRNVILINNYIIIQRCNAVHFESNLCEEAKLKELREADVDEEEKDILIRLEDAR